MTYIDRAFKRVPDLQMKRAAVQVAFFPFYAIGWTVGGAWWLIKFVWIVMVDGFAKGAGNELS